jgi:ketosteroid isomerase-like protein
MQTALTFLGAWARNDMDTVVTLLAQDVSFESPQHRLAGRDAVAAAMGEFAQVVTGIDLLVATATGAEVIVMYDMHTAPFGTLRVAEHFTVRDGLIAADQLVFDTAPLLTGV